MVKEHNVLVKITNATPFNMTYLTAWYDSGRLADNFSWCTIAGGNNATILNYEKDWSLAGCSGCVTYSVDGTDITIAFSNPAAGRNKLDVGLDGTRVWHSISDQNYKPFTRTFLTRWSAARLVFYLQCSGGTTNNCDIKIVRQ